MSRALLFLHGGSYTKECWNPIIRRLQQSPLLQRMPCEIAAFDWRFHGEKSDHSIAATLSYRDGDETNARVDHPLREWTKWGADDVRHQVQNLRALNSTMDIVAIGHSMGATTMLQVEIETPGTFQGIIAFEPVHKQKNQTDADRAAIVETLVSVASSRVSSW
jgi:pimeloyl-ACP methyl ester carboxylesterase